MFAYYSGEATFYTNAGISPGTLNSFIMTQINTPIPVTSNIWSKLFRIQNNVKHMLNTQGSGDKKPGTNESDYFYTPGWKITMEIRKLMDIEHVMMVMNVIDEKHEPYEYPVYKNINNKFCTFNKKDLLSTVTIEYTWIDADSGETAGPFKIISVATNDNNKSATSAISLAERYIFLKFFHIATKDKDDEIDSIDSKALNGVPNYEQPVNATRTQILTQNHNITTQALPNTVQPTPATQNPYNRQKIYDALENMNPIYKQAVINLMNYEQGTPSHNIQLVKELKNLNLAGFPTADPEFSKSLVEISQAYRTSNFTNIQLH